MDTLNGSVLVLNKYYNPVNITTVRRAFCMVFKKIAEVINVEQENFSTYNFSSWAEFSEYKRMLRDGLENEWVYTPNLTLLVPRVVRVLSYDRVEINKVRLTRRNIYYRDGNMCQYCGKKFKTKDLNIDHVIPKSRGGKEVWSNLVCACVECNIRKSNKLPHEVGMKLIRKPARPQLNPLIIIHLSKKKYASWKSFLSEAYWNVELQQ